LFQENKVMGLEEAKTQLEDRLEDVLGRLKDARNVTNVEEAYKQEVRAQSRLADIYKGETASQISSSATSAQNNTCYHFWEKKIRILTIDHRTIFANFFFGGGDLRFPLKTLL
jgi:hypothetical protein